MCRRNCWKCARRFREWSCRPERAARSHRCVKLKDCGRVAQLVEQCPFNPFRSIIFNNLQGVRGCRKYLKIHGTQNHCGTIAGPKGRILLESNLTLPIWDLSPRNPKRHTLTSILKGRCLQETSASAKCPRPRDSEMLITCALDIPKAVDYGRVLAV